MFPVPTCLGGLIRFLRRDKRCFSGFSVNYTDTRGYDVERVFPADDARCRNWNTRSLRHLERHDVDFVLVCINVCGQNDVVPLVSFDRIWVADGPALAVYVTHKCRAVIGDLTVT